MVVWSAEQAAEITTELIDLEFLPTSTNVDRGVRNLEFVLQQMHTALMALLVMRQMTLLSTRGRTRWRDGEDCRNALIRRQEEDHEASNDHFSWTVLSSGSSSEDQTMEVLRVERRKKLKDKVDDESRLAGLEALVPEELERHLILNSNRLCQHLCAHTGIVGFVYPLHLSCVPPS